jgi:hypothetical protein
MGGRVGGAAAGSAKIQIAWLGAYVIATASNEAKTLTLQLRPRR